MVVELSAEYLGVDGVHQARDVIVVAPGITRWTLHRDVTDVWGPSVAGVHGRLASLGGSIGSIRLPDDIGDERPTDGGTLGRLMPGLHLLSGPWTPVRGYDQPLTRVALDVARDRKARPVFRTAQRGC